MPDDRNEFLAMLRAIRAAVAHDLAAGIDPGTVRRAVAYDLRDVWPAECDYNQHLIARTIADALCQELKHA